MHLRNSKIIQKMQNKSTELLENLNYIDSRLSLLEKQRQEKIKEQKRSRKSSKQSFTFTKMLNQKSGTASPGEFVVSSPGEYIPKVSSKHSSNSNSKLFFLSNYGKYIGENIENVKDYVEVLRQKQQIRGSAERIERQGIEPYQRSSSQMSAGSSVKVSKIQNAQIEVPIPPRRLPMPVKKLKPPPYDLVNQNIRKDYEDIMILPSNIHVGDLVTFSPERRLEAPKILPVQLIKSRGCRQSKQEKFQTFQFGETQLSSQENLDNTLMSSKPALSPQIEEVQKQLSPIANKTVSLTQETPLKLDIQDSKNAINLMLIQTLQNLERQLERLNLQVPSSGNNSVTAQQLQQQILRCQRSLSMIEVVPENDQGVIYSQQSNNESYFEQQNDEYDEEQEQYQQSEEEEAMYQQQLAEEEEMYYRQLQLQEEQRQLQERQIYLENQRYIQQEKRRQLQEQNQRYIQEEKRRQFHEQQMIQRQLQEDHLRYQEELYNQQLIENEERYQQQLLENEQRYEQEYGCEDYDQEIPESNFIEEDQQQESNFVEEEQQEESNFLQEEESNFIEEDQQEMSNFIEEDQSNDLIDIQDQQQQQQQQQQIHIQFSQKQVRDSATQYEFSVSHDSAPQPSRLTQSKVSLPLKENRVSPDMIYADNQPFEPKLAFEDQPQLTNQTSHFASMQSLCDNMNQTNSEVQTEGEPSNRNIMIQEEQSYQEQNVDSEVQSALNQEFQNFLTDTQLLYNQQESTDRASQELQNYLSDPQLLSNQRRDETIERTATQQLHNFLSDPQLLSNKQETTQRTKDMDIHNVLVLQEDSIEREVHTIEHQQKDDPYNFISFQNENEQRSENIPSPKKVIRSKSASMIMQEEKSQVQHVNKYSSTQRGRDSIEHKKLQSQSLSNTEISPSAQKQSSSEMKSAIQNSQSVETLGVKKNTLEERNNTSQTITTQTIHQVQNEIQQKALSPIESGNTEKVLSPIESGNTEKVLSLIESGNTKKVQSPIGSGDTQPMALMGSDGLQGTNTILSSDITANIPRSDVIRQTSGTEMMMYTQKSKDSNLKIDPNWRKKYNESGLDEKIKKLAISRLNQNSSNCSSRGIYRLPQASSKSTYRSRKSSSKYSQLLESNRSLIQEMRVQNSKFKLQ